MAKLINLNTYHAGVDERFLHDPVPTNKRVHARARAEERADAIDSNVDHGRRRDEAERRHGMKLRELRLNDGEDGRDENRVELQERRV
jgi:hypothetical protein